VRVHAAQVLAAASNPAKEGALRRNLKERDPSVLIEILHAFTTITQPRTVHDLLIIAASHRTSTVRAAAEAALRTTSGPTAIKALVRVLTHDHYPAVLVARILHELGPSAKTPILQHVGNLMRWPDKRVRTSLSRVLEGYEALQDADVVFTYLLITFVSNELSGLELDNVKRKAKDLLLHGYVYDGPLVDCLMLWQTGPLLAERLQTAGWIPQDDEQQVHFWVAKRDARRLLGDWCRTEAVLLNDLESSRYENCEGATYSLIGLGKEEHLGRLITMLETKGRKEMAETFLNSGHAALSEAARLWACRHGHYIHYGRGGQAVRWKAFR
jgi:hypothetical protein